MLSSKVNRVPYSASLKRENFDITVQRISVQPSYTISRIRLILQGLGLSANLLLGKLFHKLFEKWMIGMNNVFSAV